MPLLMTPKDRLPFWVLLAVPVFSGPVLDIAERYNPETGYVIIPLGLDALTVRPMDWLVFWAGVGLPFGALAWLALREYPGRISLLTVNRDRPYWTMGLSVVCLFAIVSVSGPIWPVSGRPAWASIWVIRSLAWAYWFLAICSALVISNAFARPGPATPGAA